MLIMKIMIYITMDNGLIDNIRGKGKACWDKILYEGEWKAGIMHGNGKHHVNDIDILNGMCEEGEFYDLILFEMDALSPWFAMNLHDN